MRNIILMQILEPQHQLPKVLSRNLGIQRDRGVAKFNIHDRPARHEFEDEVERVRGRDVDCFVEQDQLPVGIRFAR